MTTKSLPWFRMYSDFLNDPKMISLAFEDQRHFIGVLALKCGGVIDQKCAPELLDRIVAQRLWIDHAIIREVKKRLQAVNLIDENWQPTGWEKRQFRSDADPSGAERQRRFKERKRAEAAASDAGPDDNGDGNAPGNALPNGQGDGQVTPPDTESDTEAEGDKKVTRTRKRGASESSALNAKALSAEGVDRQVAADWLTLRKAKRLPLTQTAWDTVKDEAAKLGMSPAQAVKYAVDEGWAGFKASWVERQRTDGGATHARAGAQPANKQEALEARNRDVAARAAARFQSQQGGAQQ
ncbi:hypothetical protein G3O00_01690 [Burkholderia sp. Ac-20384]|uniref:hypothetical protein n=1 Tax=Burkholderia sp. Ac-20384 TaxID=2703902 RepID=UPI00197E17F0|nr:hypothetical protein [Burkholderia sp. Ac-20384]MBN3822330.1 hypothetical protein [Burkholderia sp. Ac-20384]